MARWPQRRRPLDPRDVAPYGTPSRGRVDLDRAARGLRAPKAAVSRAIAAARRTASTAFLRGVSGRPDANTFGGPRGLLQAAFGKGPRGGPVNAKKAADALGVSEGTVRRWATGAQQPSGENLAALKTVAGKVTTTKAGRKSLVNEFRSTDKGKAALRNGAQVKVSGFQGPKDSEYCRDRRVSLLMDRPEDIEAMLQAYENGGEAALHDWMTRWTDTNYVGDWRFMTVDEFEIEADNR